MNEIKREFKGNVGLFLVCTELSKLNLAAMPTSRNMKGYDVVVFNPETNIGLGIQIKCTDRKQKDFPILTSHWRNYKKMIEDKIIADFVFVDISNPDKPDYYIVAKEVMKHIINSSCDRYLSEYQQRHNMTFEQMLEKKEKEKRKPDLIAIGLSDIERYSDIKKHKNNWQVIIDRLQKT